MVSRYSITREVSLGVLNRVAIDGLVLDRPIHILHRKGKHLSPLVRRFLTFAGEYVAEADGTLKRLRKCE
jgi:DNA-binding transcriptional LysR family regulator